ncbi:MAG TPA: ABC transporter permease [Puia sp.]|uniref:ABC transporter permease n=1 Tax=Puia sp. TaxID=2045100 RepID=UPI002CB937B1|nr:ABC transporter permease [Puia sp.]HVU94767.1 ABC transporter permease [Puia sp.]
MFSNYILTTLRSLRNKPTYSLLNMAGLALGIACATLIFLWVEDEVTWDHSVADSKHIYWTRLNMPYNGTITSFDNVPGVMAPEAIKTIPGIRYAVRLTNNERRLFTVGEKLIYENGTFADSSYFQLLKIPFLKGNPSGCLRLKHSIVLTESTARKFFGDTDPMGKTLLMGNSINYTVTGIVPDFPENVTLHFNWLAAWEDYTDELSWLTTWGSFGRPMILELEPGADPNSIANKLTAIIRPKDMAYARVNMLLWPMKDWHLYNHFVNGKQDGGSIKFVRLFSLIASIILFIACINFMNLATARAGQRAREVGVRKTLGALKQSLISRFIAESLLLAFLSVIGAVLLVVLALPAFNDLVGKELVFHPFTTSHLIGLVTIGIGCGLLSGSYPAFYLSSFNPVTVLKGLKVHARGGAGFIRKTLVTTQFVVSVALIICTIIIYQQVRYVKDRDLGFEKQNLLYLDVQGKMAEHFDGIRNHLMATGVLDNVALSFSPPLQMWSGTDNQHFIWEGDDMNSKEFITRTIVTPGFIATSGLKIVAGRDFYPNAAVDSTSVIINESLATLMGKAGKAGNQVIMFDGQNRVPATIVGIVNNFVYNDMYAKPAPMYMTCNPKDFSYCHSIDMRLRKGTTASDAIAKITAVIKADNPGYPVEVKFADEQYDRLFRDESRIGKLAGLFASLAILISCLGLFGLAAYTAEQRTKELGIRKVLGASVPGLTGLLSREFLQLVGLSCLIAFPLAAWTMNGWLASYAYRTPIHWWVFAAAGLGALGIALLTVSFQAVRAALANPVKTLRSE